MRVAVLGGGYAGLVATRRLEDRLPESAELLLVDESGTHLIQHELHRVIRRPALSDELTVPLEEVLDRATVVEERVQSIDPGSGTAELADETLSYDVGIVALGAETAFYDLPGIEAHATQLKRIEHARAIRADVLPVLEAGGRVVVAGAGLSGIQVAGEVAAMGRERDGDATVVLLEQREAVAPTFPPTFQRAVRDALEDRDVVVHTGSAVASADGDAVSLATDDEIPYDSLVWTGGIRGPDAVDGNRPTVRSDLRLAGDTFVAGDVARVVDDHGRAVPASARTAIGQARVAATNVARVVGANADPGAFGPRLERYVDTDPGWIVSVGNGTVAQVGGTVFTGRAAFALKTSVGAGYLSRVGAIRRAVDLVRSELGVRAPGEEEDGTREEAASGPDEANSGPDETDAEAADTD